MGETNIGDDLVRRETLIQVNASGENNDAPSVPRADQRFTGMACERRDGHAVQLEPERSRIDARQLEQVVHKHRERPHLLAQRRCPPPSLPPLPPRLAAGLLGLALPLAGLPHLRRRAGLLGFLLRERGRICPSTMPCAELRARFDLLGHRMRGPRGGSVCPRWTPQAAIRRGPRVRADALAAVSMSARAPR